MTTVFEIPYENLGPTILYVVAECSSDICVDVDPTSLPPGVQTVISMTCYERKLDGNCPGPEEPREKPPTESWCIVRIIEEVPGGSGIIVDEFVLHC